MKVVRFMPIEELVQMLHGKIIVNHTDHSIGHKSTAKGSCFAELTETRDSNKWWPKLAGCVHSSNNIFAVEFEVDDANNPLKPAMAVYASDDYAGTHGTISVREWCTEAYGKTTMQILRIGCAPNFLLMMMGHKDIMWIGGEQAFWARLQQTKNNRR